MDAKQSEAVSRILSQKDDEIEHLRAALHEIINLDHHNHGPESRASEIARAALNSNN